MRFNPDCETNEEIEEYYVNRAVQLLGQASFHNIKFTDYGAITEWSAYFGECVSIYVRKSQRTPGEYKKIAKNLKQLLFTIEDCDLTSYLNHNFIRHRVLNNSTPGSYNEIASYYGDIRAKRSGVLYMNHIDEGLAILRAIDAPRIALDAFCLHPIFQTELDRPNTVEFSSLENNCILLAKEYAKTANASLPHNTQGDIDKIKLSPFEEVNQMLIADKVQNFKDFKKYHRSTHPNAAMLERYFINWLTKLNVIQRLDKLEETITLKYTKG